MTEACVGERTAAERDGRSEEDEGGGKNSIENFSNSDSVEYVFE